ncbi:hypothetical protein ABZ806_44650 [Spirillospora sp. NPDC047418]
MPRSWRTYSAWRGTRWTSTPVSTNGQLGILLYLNTDDGLRPHTLQVFESGDPGTGIGHVLVYQDSQLFELFEKDLATDR